MLILQKSNLELGASRRLVKASEVAAIHTLESLLSSAESEARSIVAAAQAEYERQKQLGYEAGVDAGKEDISFQKLDLVEQSIEYLEKMENRVVEIVLTALRKCVDEIGDRQLMVQIILNAMRAIVRNQQQVRLKVPSAMVADVRSRLQEILSRFPNVNYIDVVEDEHLEGLSCVLETDAGNVDASLNVQLAAIERVLRKCFEHN